jgi:hypothetical protein
VGPRLVGYTVVLLVLVVVALWARHEGVASSTLSRGESWAVAALFGWLLINLVRAGPRWDTALAATVLAALAFMAPWALTRMGSGRSAAEMITAILGAAIVGSAIAAWVIPLVLGQGIHWRPGLPIGGASNNAVGLTLAMAGAVARVRMRPEQRWLWRALAVAAGLLIVQSLSRAGWLLALVLVVVVLLSHPRVSARWGVVVGGVITLVTLAELIRRRGLSLFIDKARWDNVVTGLDAWSGSFGTMIFGLGPARLWPWLSLERDWVRGDVAGTTLYDSPWGRVLYHAHSTYLEALVEYGLVGLVLLLVVLGFVVRRCVREIRRRGELSLVAVALLLSLPAMLVELYLFRGFVTAFLWWAAVMAVGVPSRRPRAASSGIGIWRRPWAASSGIDDGGELTCACSSPGEPGSSGATSCTRRSRRGPTWR